MSEIQSNPARFDVRILEDGTEIAKLIPHTTEHQDKIVEYLGAIYEADPTFAQETNKKIFSVFNTSLLELLKIINIVKDRIVDIHYKMGLSDKYKIVVAYDTNSKIPQALGLVITDRPNLKDGKCIELFSLITSVWNLNCPQNENHPNRVKGAGSSIIEFCKKLGVEHKAKYLYLTGATSALPFYEAHGFKPVRSDAVENKLEAQFFATTRVPMFFDLEASSSPAKV